MQKIIKFVLFTLAVSIVLQNASAVTYVAGEPVVFEGSPVTVYPNGQVLCVKNEKGLEGRSNRRLLLYNLEKKEELSLKITPLTERVHQLSLNGQALFAIDGDPRRLFFHKKKDGKWDTGARESLFVGFGIDYYKPFQNGEILALVSNAGDFYLLRRKDRNSWVFCNCTNYVPMSGIYYCDLNKRGRVLLVTGCGISVLYDQKDERFDTSVSLLNLRKISHFDVSQDGLSLLVVLGNGCVQLYEKRESWQQNSDFAMDEATEAFFCQNDMLAIKYRDNTLSFYAKKDDQWIPELQFSINKNIEFHNISENEQVLGIAADGKIAIYKKIENKLELFYECENQIPDLKSMIVFDDASFITTHQGENNETILVNCSPSCC